MGQSFGYDPWGNLQTITATKCSAPILNAAADNKNHMIGFNYDAAGNLTREGSGTPSWNYLWDAENRLSSISGSAADTFTYDGDGERVKKSNGALFWRQHGGPFLTKTNLSGTVIVERIFFNGLHVAAAHPPSGPVNYLFQDHLGGEHIVTDASGNVCQDVDSLPFGSEVFFNSACPSSYRFAGMERDDENSANLDYAIGRYYDNRLGRFLSPDEFTGGPVDAYSPKDPLPPGPLPYADITNPQSLNKYAYVNNNPLLYIDPNGHELEVAPELQDWVTEMRTQSTSFDAELAAHEGPNNPNLTINTGNTPNDPDGSPSIGNTSASIGGGPVVDCSPNCVPVDRPYTYKGATVTVNDSVKGDKSKTQDVLGHEVGHVKDARTNTNQYHKDSQNTQQTKGKTAHDNRPEEQRANQYKNQVNQERKQWEKQHCHGFFHKACS